MHLKNSNRNSACDMWPCEKATSLSLLYKQILQSVIVFKQLFLRKKQGQENFLLICLFQGTRNRCFSLGIFIFKAYTPKTALLSEKDTFLLKALCLHSHYTPPSSGSILCKLTFRFLHCHKWNIHTKPIMKQLHTGAHTGNRLPRDRNKCADCCSSTMNSLTGPSVGTP